MRAVGDARSGAGTQIANVNYMKIRSILLSALFTFSVTIYGTLSRAGAEAEGVVVTIGHSSHVDTITSRKFGVIKLEQPELNPTAERVYDSLTDAQRAKFDRTRLWLLKKLAVILSRSDVQIETAYVEQDTVRLEDVAGDVFDRDDTPSKSHQRIQTILETIHNVLWQNPAAASAANEHGLMILIGLQAQIGLKSKLLKRWNVPEKAIGGAGFLGIQIGYNEDLKKAIIEFSFRTESLYSGAVTNLGQVLRIYPYMRSRREGDEGELVGRSSNPPSPPFMGYGFEYSPTYLSMGYNNAWFSLPGEWTSALHFVNEFHQRSLLRLSLASPSSLWQKTRDFFSGARQNAQVKKVTCAGFLREAKTVYDDLQ